MSDEDADLRDMDLRRRVFITKYGPHDEFSSDMSELISEVSHLRRRGREEGYLDDNAKKIIGAFRHMVTRSADHGFKDNGCYLCDDTRGLIEAIRGGEI